MLALEAIPCNNVKNTLKREMLKYVLVILLFIDNAAKVSPATRITPATPAPTIPDDKLLQERYYYQEKLPTPQASNY